MHAAATHSDTADTTWKPYPGMQGFQSPAQNLPSIVRISHPSGGVSGRWRFAA
eukprot:m.811559 g.811559  ORF g.811559 m.811559 type:complete len:53 (+) comp59335_c0_seq14:1859-2017(+)